ncbi:MAG TPA: hypothetical protein VF855_03925 [Acidimicrobiales bacterium]
MTAPATAGIVIGTIGSARRVTVTPWGAVVPHDGSPVLDWWVAADDRWHVPSVEPTVRQRRIDGAPVVETALRVPDGDAVQRVYAVADGGGLVVVEVENRSPLPFAVAFSRGDLLLARPPTAVPVQGIELPPRAAVLPVGHRTSVRVALPLGGGGAGRLPGGLPTPVQVARGWLAQLESGFRVVLPGLSEALVAARCDVLLGAPQAGDDVAFLLTLGERCRSGDDPREWVGSVAAAVERVASQAGRPVPWDAFAALRAAQTVLVAAGEVRAAADVDRLLARLGAVGPPPPTGPAGVRAIAWIEALVVTPPGAPAAATTRAGKALVDPAPDPVDILPGFRPDWLGQGLEVYRAPTGLGTVSFAVRWHASRPALLWECTPAVALTCRSLDPSWRAEPVERGEALLGVPPTAGGVPER